MKVLMFGWEFPPHISGGLGTACYGLTKDLVDLGVEVSFVLPKLQEACENQHLELISPDHVEDLIVKENRIEEFQQVVKKYEVVSNLTPYLNEDTYQEMVKTEQPKDQDESKPLNLKFSGTYGASLMDEVARYAAVGRYMAQKQAFDIIHAHDWMTYQAGIEAKIQSGKPLVIHVHATEFDRSIGGINDEIYQIEKRGMDYADLIIAVSNRTRDIIIHKYHQNPAKIHVVYNAVDKSDIDFINSIIKISSFANDKIVLFLGRITKQKGPEYFVHAANTVLKKFKNARFVMAGDGDMTKPMIELAASLNIADRFHFTGFLKAPQREKLFAMSDLFVMPSVSEPFGITPLEAMKHDIPIIISKQSGVAEILDHVIKVDFWDVPKLAEEIIHVLKDQNARREMIERNKKTLEYIDWKKAANQVKDIYSNVIQ